MFLRPSIWLASALVFSSAAFAAANEISFFSGDYLAGRTAGRLKDNPAAISFLDSALKLEPENPVLIERLFQILVSVGDIAKAETLAAKVVTFNSQQRMARLVLGLKEFKARRYTEARAQFAQSAYTPVGELTAALLGAWSYAGEGSLGAATKELKKLDGQDSFANYQAFHLALIDDYLGSSIKAEPAYRQAYAVSGTSLRVTQAYGNFLERSGRKDEAQKIYESFSTNNQRNVVIDDNLKAMQSGQKPVAFITTPGQGAAEALFSLAAALNGEQSADVAVMYAQLALSFNAAQPITQSLLGDIYTDMKDSPSAIAIFDKVPQDSPLRNYADTEIALNLQRLGSSAEAAKRLQTVLARDPNNLDAWTSIGGIYRNTNELQKAVEAYTKAIDLMPSSSDSKWQLYYYRGITFDRQKNFEKSEADFRTALSLSKDEPAVLNYLGYSLIDRGLKLDEAIGMVKKAVELKPNDGYIVDSLGWAYFTMGDFEQAVNNLERAVDLNPADPIIAEHLGDAYWHVNRRLESQFQWQHAKDNGPEKDDLQRIEGKLKNGLIDVPKAKPSSG